MSKFQIEPLGDSVMLSDFKSRYGQLTSLEERYRKFEQNMTFTSGFQLGISSQDSGKVGLLTISSSSSKEAKHLSNKNHLAGTVAFQ